MRRAVTWAAGSLALVGAALLVLITTEPTRPSGGGNGRLSAIAGSVAAATPAVRTINVPVTFAGVVGAAEPLAVYPQVAGPIAEIDVAPGQKVTAGQVVARLSDTQGLAAKRSQARAALDQAQVTLDDATSPAPSPPAVTQARAQVSAAQTDLQDALDRQQRDARATPDQRRADAQSVAAARQRLASAQDALDAAQHPEPAPADRISAARSAVDAARSTLDAADGALAQLTVTTPAGGTIASIAQHVGETAAPNAPLAQLAGSAHVVSAHVSPAAARQLTGHLGAAASVTLAVANPPPATHGHLGFVAPDADPRTQQTSVTLRVAGGTLRPGEPVTATVTVPLGRRTTVPTGAIAYVDGDPGVYVLTDVLDPARLGITLPATVPDGAQIATARFRRVFVVATVSGRTAIRSGLPSHAQVVTTGQTAIDDGARVAVLPESS